MKGSFTPRECKVTIEFDGIPLLLDVTMESSGSSLPLIFCIHVRSGPIYWGVIYLAEKIIR